MVLDYEVLISARDFDKLNQLVVIVDHDVTNIAHDFTKKIRPQGLHDTTVIL